MAGFRDTLIFSNGTFSLLQDLIHQRTGLIFSEGKEEILAEKLAGRIVERGFNNLLDYYYLLKYDPQADSEWREVMNRLSVPETYFWREYDQIKALVDEVIPAYFARPGVEPLRIWCAACASGEEPLTLVMSMNEAGLLGKYPIEVMASDASPRSIQKAESGLYQGRSFRSIPDSILAEYFTPEGEQWRIDPAIHQQVTWRLANLMQPNEIESMARSHVIFCRNVFIYFSEPSITRTVNYFAQQMRTPAYLFVGISESLLRLSTPFHLKEVKGAFVYQLPN